MRDSRRHALYIDGDKEDVAAILLKLGNHCGRPRRVAEPYTYRFYIHSADAELLDNAADIMAAAAAESQRRARRAAYSRRRPLQNPAPGFRPPPAVVPEEAPPAPAQEENPPDAPAFAGPDPTAFMSKTDGGIESPAQAAQPEGAAAPPQNSVEEEKPPLDMEVFMQAGAITSFPGTVSEGGVIQLEEPSAEGQAGPDGADVFVRRAANETWTAPSFSGLGPPEQPRPMQEAQQPFPGAEPGAEPFVISPRDTERQAFEIFGSVQEDAARAEEEIIPPRPWSLEMPVNPLYTFDTLVVGANRFAHAAANSVVENPGGMYNPLVIFGPAGSGKTHFINAVAYALLPVLGQEALFFTDGARFSRGMEQLASGGADELKNLAERTRAVFIDDIDLMSVSDANRVSAAQWLDSAVKGGKQIVVASSLPPEQLVALEENLGFKFDTGWSAELKCPSGKFYGAIVSKMMESSGIALSDESVFRLFGKSQMPLDAVRRIIADALKLEKLSAAAGGAAVQRADAFDMLLAADGGGDKSLPDVPELQRAADSDFSGREWGRWAFLCQTGDLRYVRWAALSLTERAREMKLEGGFEITLAREYDYARMADAAYDLAEACRGARVKSAVILLPADGKKAARDEFARLVRHILEAAGTFCATLEMEQLKSPSAYSRILLDLI